MNEEHGHLLVVDDNEMNRDLLSRRLVRRGHSVETAEGGLQLGVYDEHSGEDLGLLIGGPGDRTVDPESQVTGFFW